MRGMQGWRHRGRGRDTRTTQGAGSPPGGTEKEIEVGMEGGRE